MCYSKRDCAGNHYKYVLFDVLTQYQPVPKGQHVSCLWSVSSPPEITRKPFSEVFKGYRKGPEHEMGYSNNVA